MDANGSERCEDGGRGLPYFIVLGSWFLLESESGALFRVPTVILHILVQHLLDSRHVIIRQVPNFFIFRFEPRLQRMKLEA
jgi:hypothetical protein